MNSSPQCYNDHTGRRRRAYNILKKLLELQLCSGIILAAAVFKCFTPMTPHVLVPVSTVGLFIS